MNQSGDIVASKKQIRKMLLERRRSLSEDSYVHKNFLINERLKALDMINRAKSVHTFIPIPGRHEVDTWPIIHYLIRHKIKVVVPVMQLNSIELRHVYLDDFDSLRANKWGVMEPESQSPANLKDVDVVLVPMLGGDKKGNRIGYGKGYYDSFLKETKGLKLGLLYEMCLLDEVPAEPHDVSLDALMTEERYISVQTN